jgi:hypothetical protein
MLEKVGQAGIVTSEAGGELHEQYAASVAQARKVLADPVEPPLLAQETLIMSELARGLDAEQTTWGQPLFPNVC